MNASLKLDEGTKGFLILFLLAQLFFTNGVILFVGMLIFFMLFYSIQQPNKPSVFTIILIYHFIQISAAVWQSNYLEKDINFRSPNTMYAVLASYVGLIFLFLPIIYYQNKIPKLPLTKLKEHANKLSIEKSLKIYVIGFFAINALSGLAFFIPSLTQVILSLGNIKWFLFLLFGYQSILKNEKRKELYIFCAIEFSLGFLSYFSEFKTIIFFICILLLTTLSVIKFNRFIFVIISIVFIFFGGVFWTSIKNDYRSFLNQGSKSQSVQVEKADALNKLIDLSEKSNSNSIKDATDNFLDRLQYTYHFAKSMDRVPSVIPYQDGANLGSTLSFVLTPRILNPDKGVYDASTRATKYTGIQYYGIKRGTSVSLGYFADCYIDFGIIGMFIPLLIFGFIYGSSYFYFIKNASNNFIFNYSIVGAMYMELFAFESDSIFVFGRLYVNLVVFFALKYLLFPKLIKYLTVPEKVTNQN